MNNGGAPDVEIGGLSIDSRRVRAGDLFFALRGGRADGNAFIAQALGRGAAAVLTDDPRVNEIKAGSPVVIEVGDGRLALARIAANFTGNPSRRLSVAGVTGTNGKTTTALLIRQALERLGRKTGLIGTIKYIVGRQEKAAAFTTPEAPDFQSMLRGMLDAGQTHAVAEVSSHALAQRRVDCTTFKTAVFTNLTRDHLDFHKTMEDYFEAKKRLFTELLDKDPHAPAVINMDDPFGRRLARELSGKSPVLGFGTGDGSDIRAASIRNRASGLGFRIVFRGGSHAVNSELVGAHNVYNLLSAFGAMIGLGVSADDAAAGIQCLEGVKGRFERVECGQDFLVVVDYAHTPDALQRLIGTARAIIGDDYPQGDDCPRKDETAGGPRMTAPAKIILVFGCGGDRDRGKRPEMGRIAAGMADFVIVTSDNPRSEDPLSIIDQIGKGMDDVKAGGKTLFIPDRAEAIRRAILSAGRADIVLIAGKGHEDYQEINGVRHPFSDQLVAAGALKEMAARGRRDAQA
ncbi:MAG: UDP-N-acetylmuramoyl-L-alanyl-D-glutamate--2,6-diaminopimelate ligase [Nitrospiraceae bacterium]|nr:UDP-N-acetylmuramoyl-L-alanyl-D-glutamate--2,6-diaminopimelate ligase [Nitrospiraceae bacterium]